MRRLATLLVLLLAVAPAAFAQPGRPMPQGQITGTVLDADTGEPIGSAAVAVWSAADSALVTGAITDPAGAFAVERLRPGGYYVEVSFLGYATERIGDIALRPGSLAADLGQIRLAPQAEQLGEVAVEAERELVQVEVDRTVYNVADQPVAQSGSASDVLQNVPSVEVDIDGNVSLRGNQNVAILINGRSVPVSGEFLANLLRQMPASQIERVEVLPNPGAKYDPAGMGGIINIVTKENTDLGLNGGLIVGAGTSESYNASGNVGYQRGRVNAYASYGFRQDQRESSGFDVRENRYATPRTFFEQDQTGGRRFTSHLLNTSLDYTLTKQAVLGFTGLLSVRDGAHDSFTAYDVLDDDRALMSRLARSTDGGYEGFNTDLALTYAHTFAPQTHTLNAEVRYNYNDDQRSDTFGQQPLMPEAATDVMPTGERNVLDFGATEGTLQLDYVRPVLGGRLEVGYKGSLRRLDNALAVDTLDALTHTYIPHPRSNSFDYDERVLAGYLTLGRGFGPFETQLGVRVEQTATEFALADASETYENDYVSVFPSAFVTYQLAEGRQLKASYAKRINRPNTWFLNPFAIQDDPLNLRRGNPYLGPEYTHAFELGYTQFLAWGSLTLTPYYRHATDVIRRRTSIDEHGVTTTTFENFATSDSYGLEAIASVRPAPWLNGFVSFNGYRTSTDGSNVSGGLSSDAFGWMGRANASVQLPRGLDLQLTYFYRSPMELEQGRISSFQMSDVALRKRLLGEQASLTLRVSDVFDQMGFAYSIDQPEFAQEAERKWESRIATLTFTYNFGSPQRQRPPQPREGGMPDGGFEPGLGM